MPLSSTSKLDVLSALRWRYHSAT